MFRIYIRGEICIIRKMDHQYECHEYVFFLFIIYENVKATVRKIRKKKEEINEEDYDKISFPDIDNNNFDLLPYDKNLNPLIIIRVWRGTPSKDLVKVLSETFIHNQQIKQTIEEYKNKPDRSNTILPEEEAFIYSLRGINKSMFSVIPKELNNQNVNFFKDIVNYYISFPNFLLMDVKFNSNCPVFYKHLFFKLPYDDVKINEFVYKIDYEERKTFDEIFKFFLELFTSKECIDSYQDKKEIIDRFKELIGSRSKMFFKKDSLWKPRKNNKTEYPELLKKLYLYCFNNNRELFNLQFFNTAEGNTTYNTYEQLSSISRIIPNMNENELLALIYLKDFKAMFDFDYLIPLISLDTIFKIHLKLLNNRVFGDKIDKYFEFYESVIQQKNDKKKRIYYVNEKINNEQIDQIVPLQSINQFDPNGSIYKIDSNVNNPQISFMYNSFYRFSLTKNKYEAIKAFKYNPDNKMLTLNIDNNSFITFIEKVSKEKNISIENIINYKEILIQYMQNNVEIKLKDYYEKDKEKNSLEDKTVEEILSLLYHDSFQILLNNMVNCALLNNSNEEMISKIKEDISHGYLLEREYSSRVDLINYFFEPKKEELNKAYHDLYHEYKQTKFEGVFPSIVDKFDNTEILSQLNICKDINKNLLKYFLDIQEKYCLKHHYNNGKDKLCYYYGFIINNLDNFYLIEQIAGYANKTIETSFGEGVIFIKDERIEENDVEFIEFFDNSLNYILNDYKFPESLDNFNINSFSYLLDSVNYLQSTLGLLNQNVFKLQFFETCIYNLSQGNDGYKNLKAENIFDSFKNTNELIVFLEQNKTLFKDFNSFFVDICTIKYKATSNVDDKALIIEKILEDYNTVKCSKKLLSIYLNYINSFSIESNQEEDKVPNEIINGFLDLSKNKILDLIEEKLKDKNISEALEQIIINIFENYALSQIDINNKQELLKPLVLDYFNEAASNLIDNTEKTYLCIFKLYCIAICKVIIFGYMKMVKKGGDDSFDLSTFNSIIKSQKGLSETLKIHILKYIRRWCSSFHNFMNYNFLNNQLLWAADMTFKPQYPSNFEYNFISEFEYNEKYLKDLDIVTNDFLTFQEKTFRTNLYDDELTGLIKSDNFDMFVDIIFNHFFSSKLFDDININLEYYKFNGWGLSTKIQEKIKSPLKKQICAILFSKTLLELSEKNLDTLERLCIEFKFCLLPLIGNYKEYMNTIKPITVEDEILEDNKHLVINNNTHHYYKYKDSWKYIDKKEHEFYSKHLNTNLDIIDVGSINKKNENNCYIHNDLNKEDVSYVTKRISHFVICSYSIFIIKDQNTITHEMLQKMYANIVSDLHHLGINNEKIFMNILYCKLKKSIKGRLIEQHLSSIETVTKDIIDNYTSYLEQYMKTMNKITGEYLPYEVRNLIMDQRINYTNDYESKYPLLKYFYYGEFPIRENFILHFNSLYNKESKYPLISLFIKEDLKEEIDVNKLPSVIEEIIKKKNRMDIIDFPSMYDENNNLKEINPNRKDELKFDELLLKHSYRNIYGTNKVNYANGELIEYDYDKIERELCSKFIGVFKK